MKIGKFRIIDSFKITGRGLVARGEIIEGIVKVGSFATIRINSQNIVLYIGGVEAIDNLSTKESWVGLILISNNKDEQKNIQNIKLEEQLVDIFDNY
jgi:translation elongation factor EF-Tu-like GTPase